MSTSEYASRRRPTAPTLLVPFPEGTNVYGAACVYHQLWGFTNRAFTEQNIYGGRGSVARTFGANAAQLSSTIFPHLSPREVLEQHTVFGFYSRAHTQQNADRWASALTAKSSTSTSLFKKYIARRARVVKPECWFCADCVDEDLAEFGYGTWRCLHQLPGVDYCHKHLRLLQAFCHACGEPYDRFTKFITPGEPCTVCAAPARRVGARAPSAGAADLAADCARAAAGELFQVRPLEWAFLLKAYARTRRDARNAVLRELSSAWDGKPPLGITRSEILKELDLLNPPGQILTRLVIYGALNRMGQVQGKPLLQRDNTEAVIQAHLADRLLPIGLTDGLLNHQLLSTLANSVGVSTARLRAAVASLPPDVQLRVTRAERVRNVPAGLSTGRDLAFEQLREKYRSKVLWAIGNWEKPTRTELWRKLPREIMWLRANDAEWLDEVQPDKIRMDVYLNRIEPR